MQNCPSILYSLQKMLNVVRKKIHANCEYLPAVSVKFFLVPFVKMQFFPFSSVYKLSYSLWNSVLDRGLGAFLTSGSRAKEGKEIKIEILDPDPG
jgi:hypothetical protein